MSQNTRNPANEGNRSSGRSANDNSRNTGRRDKEGFDGMNYEQVRGPYNPSGKQDGNNGNPANDTDQGKRRNER
jgi:hypothetical protein